MSILEDMFNTSDYGIFVYKLEENNIFRLIFANKRTAEISNIDYPTCIGLTLEELNLKPERFKHFKEQLKKCIQIHIPINYVRCGKVLGGFAYINVNLIPFYTNDGSYIIGYSRTLKSIDEIQRYAHLEFSNYFSKTDSNGYILLDRTEDGTWVCECCNDSFANIIHKKRAEVIRKPVNEFLSDAHDFLMLKKAAECLDKKQAVEYYNQYNLGGEYKFWHISMLPLFLLDRVMVYCRACDVTNDYLFQKQADDVFLKYQRLCSLSHHGIASCTLKDDILTLNLQNSVFNKICNSSTKQSIFDDHIDLIKDAVLKNNEVKFTVNLPSEDNPSKTSTYIFRVIPISEFFGEHKLLIITSLLKKKPLSDIDILTSREKQILELVTEGYTNKYIAHKLSLSEGTVKKHIYNAYTKLNVNSRIELISEYVNS